jgi:OHCU decarboxylase
LSGLPSGSYHRFVSYKVYENLARLNQLPPEKAEQRFLDCCGSSDWARRMAAARPFAMIENLYRRAADIWFSLPVADHLEAFAAHPKIGTKQSGAGQNRKSAKWSRGEQAGVESVDQTTHEQLTEANRLYEEKFGFIFIVCATGKTAAEMLAICRARLGNSVETELQIAAEEQAKITEIRLNKLLET